MLFNRVHNANLAPSHLSDTLDRLFHGVFDHGTTSAPPVRFFEVEDHYELEALVPGVRAEDLDVSVHGKRLTLKGKRTDEAREEATPLRSEWGNYEFERSFELPFAIDDTGVEAKLDAGILRLTLPKAAGHKPQKIEVLTAK